MEDFGKYRMLLTEDLIIKNPEPNIIWVASDGKRFTNKLQCEIYDRDISRQRFYEEMLKKRNWFQRLFDIKPSMKFYDEMVLKSLFK